LWLLHALPAAPTPLLQVHCFSEHTRFRVLLGVVDSYWLPLHVAQAWHRSPLK
jgi:hypothetical protein